LFALNWFSSIRFWLTICDPMPSANLCFWSWLHESLKLHILVCKTTLVLLAGKEVCYTSGVALAPHPDNLYTSRVALAPIQTTSGLRLENFIDLRSFKLLEIWYFLLELINFLVQEPWLKQVGIVPNFIVALKRLYHESKVNGMFRLLFWLAPTFLHS